MYESTSRRFARSKNNDLFVTFFPLALAFGIRGLLQKAQLAPSLFLISQILLGIFLAAAFFLSYRFYFKSFRYTLVEKRENGHLGFPAGSLTFERVFGDKKRIYERVMADEMLGLSTPGVPAPPAEKVAAKNTYCLTAQSAQAACRLYYRQHNTTYCAVFYPDEQQKRVLGSGSQKTKAHNDIWRNKNG